MGKFSIGQRVCITNEGYINPDGSKPKYQEVFGEVVRLYQTPIVDGYEQYRHWRITVICEPNPEGIHKIDAQLNAYQPA